MTNEELIAATVAVRKAFDQSGLTDKFRLGSFATDIAKAALQAAEAIRSEEKVDWPLKDRAPNR